MDIALVGIGILFFLGHGLKWIFQKTKIPDLLILIIIGYTVGPILGFISPDDFGKMGAFVSTLALVVILYEAGLNLKAKDLKESTLPALAMSVLGFLLIFSAATTLAIGLGFQSWKTAILLGLGMGSTSSAVVIPMVKHLSIKEGTKTILGLESAFTDVLAIVLFLVITDAIESNIFSVSEILIGIGPKTLLSVVLGTIAGFLWSFARKHFSDFTGMTFASESFALLSYGIVEYMGYNGAMAVLALGFILVNIQFIPSRLHVVFDTAAVSYNEMSLLQEITFLLKTFFFLYLGILISFSNWNIVLFAFMLVAVIFVTRYASVRVLFRPKNIPRLDAMVTTAMGPRGLVCVVLATIPLQKGIEGGEWLRDILYSLVPLSILFSAVFVFLSEQKGIRKNMEKLFSPYMEEDPTTLASQAVPVSIPEGPQPNDDVTDKTSTDENSQNPDKEG